MVENGHAQHMQASSPRSGLSSLLISVSLHCCTLYMATACLHRYGRVGAMQLQPFKSVQTETQPF